ncbi:cilia and flagella associated protein 58 [Cricetulus griseus]
MTEEKGEKFVLEETAFEEIERDFQEVLGELSGDKSLEKFRVEYEKLHSVMKKSYDNEKRLMAKCRELNAEIVVNSAKVATALKLSQDDQTTIASLKKFKEEVTKERDQLLSEVVKLRENLVQTTEQQQETERAKEDAQQTINQEIEKAWKMVDSAYDKEQKAKETILALKEEIVNLTKLVEQGSGLSMDQDSNILVLSLSPTQAKEEEIHQMRIDIGKLNKIREQIHKKLHMIEDQKAEVEQNKETLKNQILGLERDTERESCEGAGAVSDAEFETPAGERAAQFDLRAAVPGKPAEGPGAQKVESSKKQAELDKKAMDELLRERDILNKNMLKAVSATQKQVDLVKLHEQAKRNLEEEIQNYKAEAQKQRKIIFQLEKERDRYINEASDLTQKVISERDILGSQLVRRNDELALLYEKIKIQQSVLNKGETQYNQRVEDMRILKLEIRKLRREKGILARSVANVEELRQELFHMQREFLKERTRCRALEEELENPMNVHRWRKLEASDPSTYELIQKIHTLQKRLISKTEEVVEKELLLQEKEKLYVELKHVLARQPGPEAAEQLQIYRHTLRERTKQLKVLSSELNMYESQSQEYKYEIERLGNELVALKKKYLAQKRKELVQKKISSDLCCPLLPGGHLRCQQGAYGPGQKTAREYLQRP